MTDFFALLDQARAPWLDPAALKEIFRRKTLEQHPDAIASGSESRFAELNEAYQVLQNPKRRLHHLLSLEGCAPSANQTVPPELQELFLDLGTLRQQADLLLEKTRMASNALSQSLLKPETLALQRDLDAAREKIRSLLDAATEELSEINSRWVSDRDAQIVRLSNLYLKFAYLGRWSDQLDETAFQLSLFI
jgi:curved DNA-binding protein CbpA